MAHPLLRRLVRGLWNLAATLLILIAILFAALRLALPIANHYRDDIEAWIGQAVGRPVSLAEVDARWRGLGPEIALRDVTVFDPNGDRGVFHFGEFAVALDLASLAVGRGWDANHVRITGARIVIHRTVDGRIAVQGLDLGGEDTGGKGVPNASADAAWWLLDRANLELRDVDLGWQDMASGGALELTDTQLRLRNIPGRHTLAGSAILAASDDQRVRFAIDVKGDPLRKLDWSAQLYVDANGVRPSLAAALGLGLDLPVTEGEVNLRIWANWRNRRFQRLAADVEGFGLRFREMEAAAPSYDEISTRLFVEPSELGWRVSAEDLFVRRGKTSWPRSAFSLRRDADRNWSGRLEFSRIEDLTPLVLASGLLEEEQVESLRALQPSGDVRDLAVAWNGTGEFRASARMMNAGVRPWRKAPGIAGLGGELVVGPSGAALRLESGAVRVELPRLFRAPLDLETLNTQVRVARDGAGWRVDSTDLHAANADLSVDARVSVRLQPDTPPWLDLQASFREGRVAAAPAYLPVSIMPKPLVSWLDGALQGGRIVQGGFLLHGPAKDFPYPEAQGRFDVDFEVADGTLAYLRNWPVIENLDTKIRFSQGGMEITSQDARISGVPLDAVEVRIPDFRKDTRLLVDGVAEGETAGLLAFLRASPLSEGLEGVLKPMQASGKGRVDLSLVLPLRAGLGERKIDGTVGLVDSRLQVSDWELDLTDLAGDVQFTDRRVSAREVKGRLYGGVVELAAEVPLGPRRTEGGRITARGELQTQALPTIAKTVTLGKMSGGTSWMGRLDLPKPGGSIVDLHVESQLAGVTIDLPAPLGKPANNTRSLVMDLQLGAASRRQLRLSLGDGLSGAFELAPTRPGGLARGELLIGEGVAVLPKEGVQLVGQLRVFSVPEWRRRFGDTGDGRVTLDAGPFSSIYLQAARFQYLNRWFHQTRIAVERHRDQWEGTVLADELKGVVRVPVDPLLAPIRLDLERLVWREADADGDALPIDPRRVPAMQLQADRVNWEGAELGKLEMQTERHPWGLRMQHFSLGGDRYTITASGEWRGDARDSACSVQVKVTSDDVGMMLKQFGYASVIGRGNGTAGGDLRWDSTPGEFELRRLNGSLAVDIRKGRIVEVDPGGGRILGLLSLQALPRRLLLDFRDFFQKGFAFDRLQGKFQLVRGDAYTDDTLIGGPAASIAISGRTGLAARDYDQTVLVVPNVSSTLPLAGWAAGGPAVGAVMLFFQKLFGKRFDEGSGVTYRVTGSWENPLVERLPNPRGAKSPRAGDDR